MHGLMLYCILASFVLLFYEILLGEPKLFANHADQKQRSAWRHYRKFNTLPEGQVRKLLEVAGSTCSQEECG